MRWIGSKRTRADPHDVTSGAVGCLLGRPRHMLCCVNATAMSGAGGGATTWVAEFWGRLLPEEGWSSRPTELPAGKWCAVCTC